MTRIAAPNVTVSAPPVAAAVAVPVAAGSAVAPPPAYEKNGADSARPASAVIALLTEPNTFSVAAAGVVTVRLPGWAPGVISVAADSPPTPVATTAPVVGFRVRVTSFVAGAAGWSSAHVPKSIVSPVAMVMAEFVVIDTATTSVSAKELFVMPNPSDTALAKAKSLRVLYFIRFLLVSLD